MAAGTFTLYRANLDDLRMQDLVGATVKVALVSSAYTPDAANTGHDEWADVSANEIANGNGYTTGGNSAAVSASAQTGGVFKLTLADPAIWTASGAGFSFQYAVLVDTTAGINVGYWDYGSSQAVAAGDPELMLRLVELEAAERERDRAAALEAQRIAAEDLRQAREAHRGHWMPAVLTLALAATVAALLAGLFLVEIPAANQRAADIVLGALLGAFTTGVAYWLGSSRGSAEKSSEIATLKGGR